MGSLPAAVAQSVAPQAPAAPVPGTDSTTPVFVPTPTPQSVDQVGTRPAYNPDVNKEKAPGSAAPVPTPAPPPAVAPLHGNPYSAWPPYGAPWYQDYYHSGKFPEGHRQSHDSSVYIPVDSWIYPKVLRLYSMGYIDTTFLSMRPWTRLSLLHMLEQSQDAIVNGNNGEAQEILAKLLDELAAETPASGSRGTVYGMESAYDRVMGIGGTTLRDSWHLGQSIVNDYGRPYQTGFNNILGASTISEHGRFSLYVRGEYEHAPGAPGYSQALSSQLSTIDQIPYSGFNLNQATIPTGPIDAANPFRLVEATLSFHLLGHEISGGKSDAWEGPGLGGAMAWTNNAENMYSFRINRVEPLHIPYISALLGPLRYDFFYGSLKGHTYPNNPYAHSEMFSFRPTKNFEFTFQRTIIFGGAGHTPVTLHNFLKGFFDTSDTNQSEKFGRNDPGARFSDFSFSYRLPFVRDRLTLYADATAHDDVSPISAPRRAGILSGLYLSQVPYLPKLDLRAEAVYTDYPTLASIHGGGNYFETVQRQGYTNQGFLMGDWIGREAKGGQVFLTYHLSGNESVQLEYLNKKTAKDFIPGGTTQNSFKVTVTKRLGHDLELNGWYQFERWKAPIYLPGAQNDSIGAFQVTYFPKLHVLPGK
ncbi:capsule assembly Wzi family protein [Granulicella sp. WH15]|nr:capsule assembly Wzi family protein [Granulicella sp. WH15]